MDVTVTLPHGTGPPTFDKEAYGNYKLALKFGEAISGWDDPAMAPAARATHMRDDDYVVGLVFRGRARAYPLWIIDHYHVVNDALDGERFLVASCERCQSGAAFVADVDGNPERDPLFRSVGFLNATLLLKDMRSGSHWVHYEGAGLDRRAAGARLPWIPTYHMEWKDWVALHPDTEVMLPPDDPVHPDARHGHGREELFARPGMDPGFIATIVGPLDETYPENEMVLGIASEESWAAYPLREVQREGGVVQTSVGRRPLVVFAGPRPDGFTMAAFSRTAAGRNLSFVREDGLFADLETGTRWTIEGRAIEGPLEGQVLEPIPSFYVRWHAWIYFHRDTRLFLSDRVRPRYVRGLPLPGSGPFTTLLDALAEAGHEIRIGEPLVSQLRPRDAVTGMTVYVDGDRVNLHAFETETAARDFDTLAASWSGFPLKPRSHEGKTRRLGCVVLESDPEDRFVDPANVVPLPPSVIPWAKVLANESLDGIVPAAETSSADRGRPGFVEVVRALRLQGFEVIDVGFLPPSQLRVGAENAIALTVDAERFLLYRFPDAEYAAGYAATEPHALAVGRFAFRSTPETMYLHQGAEILYPGEDDVRWSTLLGNSRFNRALKSVVEDTVRKPRQSKGERA